MATVPGSGAIILPIFDDVKYGVDAVQIIDGGSGYSTTQPPNLIIQNCGNPLRDAKLKPVIKNGKIIAVLVLDPGEGYDPLRVQLIPQVPEGTTTENLPTPLKAKPILKSDGTLDYVQVTNSGDNQYYDVTATVLGGGGSGASIRAISKSVTSLVLLNPGRNYETAPFISITGGGGVGASGVADVDTKGIVDLDVNITNPGQFYLKEPYVLLIGGGGRGAKAKAVIEQGEISDIIITDQGQGYTSPPQVVFGRNVKVKRISRNRQSYNLQLYQLAGLTKDLDRDDTSIYVNTTDPFPGSGLILLEKEIIRYTGKDVNRLTGCTRGINFRYDQRVVLDTFQNDPDTGVSAYKFEVGDRIIRVQENASNKIAVVYDWNPSTRELYVVFVVDELAFIDAGTPGEKTNIRFEGGVADASNSSALPHILVDDEFGIIYMLTTPLSFMTGFAFEDTAEFGGDGNGLPDLVNTGTTFENQTNLDGGIPSTLYGIEETQGGQNTTLFVAGDQIKDSSQPFKISGIVDASLLDEGVDHYALVEIQMDKDNPAYYNGINYVVGETVTGANSGIMAEVVSWDAGTAKLVLRSIVPFDTGDPDLGVLYKFSVDSTVIEVRINEVGSGYTSNPTIAIADTGIYQATATSSITADQVTSIVVSNGGYGYTSKPSVTFSGGNGSGAVAEAILGGEKITGQNGASWKIKSLKYLTELRNED